MKFENVSVTRNSPNAFSFRNISERGTPRHGATTLSHERRHNELRFSMMEFFKSACTRKRSLARSLGKYDGSLNSCRVGSKVYSVSLSPKAICIGDIIPSTHPHFVHSLSPSSTPVATTLSFVYPQSVPTALSLDHPSATSRTPCTPSIHLGTSRDLWNWISSGSPE